jgi:predicted porin
MKRTAYLLTVGALTFCLPAAAQEVEVSLYGTLQPFLDNYRTVGATPEGLSPDNGGATQVVETEYSGENLPNRFRITSGTSHIGFRGELWLTKRIAAFFQVENAVNPDGDHPVLVSPWASRNSGVGLKGDYGTLFYGNWDTPYKHPTLMVGSMRGLNPFDNTLTANPGFNVPGTTTQNGRASGRQDAAFSRRQGNSIQYWTPTFYGLSARLAVSVNESRTHATEIEPSVNPVLFSGYLSFKLDKLALFYAYERHWDYFGMQWLGGSAGATFTNDTSADDAHELVAWYEFPTRTRVAGIIERLTYRSSETVVDAVNGYRRDAFYLALQQHLGDMHTLWGAFGMAGAGVCTRVGGAPCTTNGLDGMQWSVGYTFSPAKTFDIYASYYEMRTGRSAQYGLFPPVVPIAAGADTQGFGLGVMFIFDVGVRFGANKPAPEAPPEKPAAAPAAAKAPPRAAAAPPEGPQEEPEETEPAPAAEPAPQ